MTLKVWPLKLVLLSVAGIALAVYLAWYAFTHLKVRDAAVLAAASQKLDCPRDSIDIGPSYQYNEGPSEIPVTGCGRKALVLCYDDNQKYGMWGQYFTFDLICRIHEKP